MAIMTTITTTK